MQGIISTLFYGMKLTKENNKVHIGELVKNVFDKNDMSVSELARRLHCERTNVYAIFRRSSIDIELLAKLSRILNHNLLEDAIKLYNLTETERLNITVNLSFDKQTAEKNHQLSQFLEELRKMYNYYHVSVDDKSHNIAK